MITKWLVFNLIILSAVLLPTRLQAQEILNRIAIETNGEEKTRYEKRAERYILNWSRLIPRYTKLQYAGSIGIISLGGGWNYGKNHWETDFLLGLVPRNSDKHAMVTFTLKQNYIPWRVRLNDTFSFEPLSCGIFMNTLLDGDFWVRNPDRYPNGYYTFSTRIRWHVFLGERITIHLPKERFHNKSITLFYELSSCDLYLINAINNSYLRPRDYLSLAFGVKLQIL